LRRPIARLVEHPVFAAAVALDAQNHDANARIGSGVGKGPLS
jgi:hypothetical protein